MTMTSRKTIRADLVTKLKTVTLLADQSGQPHVFGYFTKDPKGVSPVACVDSAAVLYDTEGDPTKMDRFQFAVGFWVRRDGDAATADDQLDDLALELAKVMSKYYNARFVSPSASDYETIAGIPYKFEIHFVEIDG